jgi:hypothetical protein
MNNKKHRSWLFVVMLALITVAANSQDTRKLPAGKWSFNAGPYLSGDWASLPVDVESVSTSMASGGTVERVTLRNYSTVAITGAKVKWILLLDGRKVQEDESRFLTAYADPGNVVSVSYPIVNFQKISERYAKKGALTGVFRLEVMASYTEYSDGTSWALGQDASGRMLARTSGEGGPCANQACKWVTGEIPNTGTYACASNSPGTYCAVGSQGQACTETRCIPQGDRAGTLTSLFLEGDEFVLSSSRQYEYKIFN